ncbi:hypothetical protein ANTQUA_LOCUS8438 [Anthophora quadrimaculata]
MRFMVCFYRRGRTVTYVDVSGSQRWASTGVRGAQSSSLCITFVLHQPGEWQAASTVSVMPNRWSMCVSVDRQFIGCGESDAAPGE